jgi:ketosteroid isomerase-like protein
MTHPNAELMRRLDDAMIAGDLETFFGSFTDDVVVHAGGNNRFAGDYRGREELQRLFGGFMEAAGDYSFENLSYFADDERGVTLQRGTMKRDGETFETDEAFVMRFRDGKVAEFWYLPLDQAGVDAWFGG